jgi:hypothetical protein
VRSGQVLGRSVRVLGRSVRVLVLGQVLGRSVLVLGRSQLNSFFVAFPSPTQRAVWQLFASE